MVKKLTFLLKHKIASRLAFKTAVGTLALFLAFRTDFSFWPFVLMIGVALWLYFSLLAERKSIRVSFWLTWLLAFLALKFVALVFFPWLIFPIFVAMLFIILGLGRLFFTDRFLTFGIFNTIFFSVFLAGRFLFFGVWIIFLARADIFLPYFCCFSRIF